MRFLSEEQTAALITYEVAFEAVRDALIAAASDSSTVFPAVIAHGALPANIFTIKSGSSQDYAGVKIGSFWPGNESRGIPRHSTAVLVIDQETGRVSAVIEASAVNAYRTSAADAVAADALSRPDSSTLAIFGSGHQAWYECLAVSRVRPIQDILVVARDPAKGTEFCARLADEGLAARLTAAELACRQADIICAATTASHPLFEAAWVKPGTHVASMGSDARGKQELPPDLLRRALLFCDLPSQSVVIGEYQHVAEDVTSGRLRVTAIGDVLTGALPGRLDASDITVFDSSGMALQDLAVASRLLALADRGS